MGGGEWVGVSGAQGQILKARFAEERFARLQRRRGSTEARVAIFKQRVARRLRDRGFDHRYLAVAWRLREW